MEGDVSRARVRSTYEEIATQFSKTRAYAWPEVASFIESSTNVERALDVGCGNGRHTELIKHATRVVALDASRGLLEEARDRHGVDDVGFLQGDAANLPIDDDTIDLAVYVATIHHLPSLAERRHSLEELARVLAPGGRALVSAWSTAHDRFEATDDESGFDTTVDWTLSDGEVIPRFYHIYAPAEFQADIESSGLAISTFELSSGNCYTVVRPQGKHP